MVGVHRELTGFITYILLYIYVYIVDYQVNVELYGSADHTMIESKSTSVQSGENPVWNEAFLFCLESDQLNDYYLEFTGKNILNEIQILLLHGYENFHWPQPMHHLFDSQKSKTYTIYD